MTKDKELEEHRQKVRDLIKSTTQTFEEKLQNVSDKIDDIISGFDNDDNIRITFEELELIKLEDLIIVNEDVSFKKTFQDSNIMKFITYVKKGGSFGYHSHDCFEITKVLSGNLIERSYGMRSYAKDEIVMYSPLELHKPYSTMDSVYEVLFLKQII